MIVGRRREAKCIYYAVTAADSATELESLLPSLSLFKEGTCTWKEADLSFKRSRSTMLAANDIHQVLRCHLSSDQGPGPRSPHVPSECAGKVCLLPVLLSAFDF